MPDNHVSAQQANSLPPHTRLVIEIDGVENRLDPTDLTDRQRRENARQAVAGAAAPPLVHLQNLLNWPDDRRWHVLRFLAEAATACRFKTAEGVEHTDLFEAVLALMPGEQDVRLFLQGRRAAIETAALLFPNDLDTACSHIANRLRGLGVKGVRPQSLCKLARQWAQTPAAGDNGQGEEERVIDRYPEAPTSPEAVIPPGWELADDQIRSLTDKSAAIAAPVLVGGRLVDAGEGTEALCLAWHRDGGWHQRIVPRDQAASARDIVALAAHGCPVTSNNARSLVQFLSDFEARNLDVLPRARVSRQMGWQGGDGGDGFLWGHGLITAAGHQTGVSLDTTRPEAWPAGHIVFQGADDGDKQLAAGFQAEGTLPEWSRTVAPLADYPKVRLAVYASLTPPLLSLLGAHNFVVDFCGQTSQGKTTTLRVAASCWGCPDERSPAAALSTWDSTRVWIERASAILNGLPVILDDTKRCRQPTAIAQTLYDVTSGRGRGRGSPKGMQRAGTWTTVMLTTGEAPVTSFTQDGGTHARVLKMWGSPFGRADGATAKAVHALDQGLRLNYGHAGPRLVEFLLQNKVRWAAWRRHYHRLQKVFVRKAGDNPVAARMASHFAALTVCVRLAHQALALPWPRHNPLKELWADLVEEASEADKPAQALSHVMSWAYGNPGRFASDSNHEQQPTAGWAGRWDRDLDPNEPWRHIGFLPNVLKEVLKQAGFEPDPILRSWRDRNWLLVDKASNKSRYRARIGKNNAWLVGITFRAVQEVEGHAGDDHQEGEDAKKEGFHAHQKLMSAFDRWDRYGPQKDAGLDEFLKAASPANGSPRRVVAGP